MFKPEIWDLTPDTSLSPNLGKISSLYSSITMSHSLHTIAKLLSYSFQPLYCWHFGPSNSLMGGAVLCTVGLLAAPPFSTQWVPAGPLICVKPKMSLDIVNCPLARDLPQLRTTDSDQMTVNSYFNSYKASLLVSPCKSKTFLQYH